MQLLKTFLALHIKVKKHNFHAPLLNKRESFIESLKKIINLQNSFLVKGYTYLHSESPLLLLKRRNSLFSFYNDGNRIETCQPPPSSHIISYC